MLCTCHWYFPSLLSWVRATVFLFQFSPLFCWNTSSSNFLRKGAWLSENGFISPFYLISWTSNSSFKNHFLLELLRNCSTDFQIWAIRIANEKLEATLMIYYYYCLFSLEAFGSSYPWYSVIAQSCVWTQAFSFTHSTQHLKAFDFFKFQNLELSINTFSL